MVFLFNVLVAGALNLFNVIPIGENAYLGSLLSGVWGIAVLLPNLAVAVRRLRDAGHGWGNLFWILVPIAGSSVLIVLLAQPTKPAARPRPPRPGSGSHTIRSSTPGGAGDGNRTRVTSLEGASGPSPSRA